MHVLFDAFAVRPGSAAVILEGLIAGWQQAFPDDRLTVVSAQQPCFAVPAGVRVELLAPPVGGKAGSLWERTLGVRRAARRLGADAVVSGVTASALLGARCPHGVVLTDLRHELRPDQFGRGRRAARRLSYAWSFARTDGIFCISDRTRDDLLRGHRRTAERAVTTLLGADHVDGWKPAAGRAGEAPYALAFGHFGNKNVDKVLAAWTEFCADDERWTLRLVGMGASDRSAATEEVARLGLTGRVELMPWLDDATFAATFAGAGLIVFPSDFEGFGLPVVEGMRLGIPVVISADPALVEVSGGHAEIAEDLAPAPLAASMRAAIARTPEQGAAAAAYTDRFSWSGMARTVRQRLAR